VKLKIGISVVLTTIVLMLASHAIARYRMLDNEMAAVKTLEWISATQALHVKQSGRSAASLEELEVPKPFSSARFVQSGYRFSVSGFGPNYSSRAVPVRYGATGSKTFFIDQTSVCRAHEGPEAAGPSDRALQ
jgi:hypothetical protein